MSTLLLPCDGSPSALTAVKHVIDEIRHGCAHHVHLLNVQPPFNAHIARHVDREARMDFHRERAEAALAAARALLDAAGVEHEVHVEVGDKGVVIAHMASRLGCDRIVLGTVRKSGLVRAMENSLTGRVLEHSTVPVEVISAERASALERLGLPVGVGAGLTLAALT